MAGFLRLPSAKLSAPLLVHEVPIAAKAAPVAASRFVCRGRKAALFSSLYTHQRQIRRRGARKPPGKELRGSEGLGVVKRVAKLY